MCATLPIIVELPDVIDAGSPSSAEELLGLTKGRTSEAKSGPHFGIKEIPVAQLKENLKTFCSTVSGMLVDLKDVGGFKLSEVEVQVEVSAEGGIEMIGTGKIGGKGAITLKFQGPTS